MSDKTPVIEIYDSPDEGAYVADVDGERAGEAVYHMRGGRHLFVHTGIEEEYSGMGLGSRLVQYALDDVRRQGGSMVPICPFIAAYVERHPEYSDLIDADMYGRVQRARQKASDVDDQSG